MNEIHSINSFAEEREDVQLFEMAPINSMSQNHILVPYNKLHTISNGAVGNASDWELKTMHRDTYGPHRRSKRFQ